MGKSEITLARHRRIATEGALIGTLQHGGRCQNLVIVSDGAGQFNSLLHALCWIHTERLVHTLVPLNERHREDIAKLRGEIWELYRDLKDYNIQPNADQKKRKISGGTRRDTGRQCRDTFTSLKKTWHYLLDRVSGVGDIRPLAEMIRRKAAAG